MEFLALVHALGYCKQKGILLPIYSDSRTAILWVQKKEIKTKQPRTKNNEQLFALIDRALKWLKENDYSNKILKWETKVWSEIPADFNRKCPKYCFVEDSIQNLCFLELLISQPFESVFVNRQS